MASSGASASLWCARAVAAGAVARSGRPVGTGVGLRYNLGFLVVRTDWGLALHLSYNTGRSGYFNIGNFNDSQALHFAIGYPF
jgi:hypothetical protein